MSKPSLWQQWVAMVALIVMSCGPAFAADPIECNFEGFEPKELMSSSDIALAIRDLQNRKADTEAYESKFDKIAKGLPESEEREAKEHPLLAKTQDKIVMAKAGLSRAQAVVDRIDQGTDAGLGAKMVEKPLLFKAGWGEIKGIKEVSEGTEKIIADLQYPSFKQLELTFTGAKPNEMPTMENGYLCFHVKQPGTVQAHINRHGELAWLSLPTSTGGSWTLTTSTKRENSRSRTIGGSSDRSSALGESTNANATSSSASASSSSSSGGSEE